MGMEVNNIYNCNALEGLRLLPEASVDCIVTSPPYWRMRDYGIEPSWWGEDRTCAHQPDEDGYCLHCGGWLGQLGQEPTREEFVRHLVSVFGECKRVLKDTGTLWVNLGDSYSKPGTGGKRRKIPSKSLCNVPGRFADEMISDGWILRNEIIWYKPNCVPAAVTDRFTVDHEKIFFFVKHPRYAFNRQYEPYAPSTFGRYRHPMTGNGKCGEFQRIAGTPKGMMKINPDGRNMRCVWRVSPGHGKERHYAMYPEKLVEVPVLAGSPEGGTVLDPFMGAGTTAAVAKRLGRNFIGFDANAEYVGIANERCKQMPDLRHANTLFD